MVGDQLEWQEELDSAMADIDVRLRHPRRRASDTDRQPTVPELAQVNLTSELLEEIAWRVSEQIRRSQALGAVAEPSFRPTAAPSPAPAQELRSGVALVIRVRSPLFSWPRWFRRRRKHPLTTLKLSA